MVHATCIIGIPPPEGGAWGSNQPDCILSSKPEPFPALDAKIDDVCVGEMYDQCRDYLIPDDANVYNLTHKFTGQWGEHAQLPGLYFEQGHLKDCKWKRRTFRSVPIYAGVIETLQENTAVFARYNNGDESYLAL